MLKAAKILESETEHIRKTVQCSELKYDCFLSHVQKISGDVSRNIRDSLTKNGMNVWYDKEAERLDNLGMIDGVVNSSVFIIVLTNEYFERPFCLFEYCVAVVAGKSMITVLFGLNPPPYRFFGLLTSGGVFKEHFLKIVNLDF